MKIDPLKQYAKLQQALLAEKQQLESRLAEIIAVLEPAGVKIPSSSLDKITTEYFEHTLLRGGPHCLDHQTQKLS